MSTIPASAHADLLEGAVVAPASDLQTAQASMAGLTPVRTRDGDFNHVEDDEEAKGDPGWLG